MLPSTLNWEAAVTSDSPDEQVADTIDLMANYVREDSQAPPIQEVAEDLSAPYKWSGQEEEQYAERVFYYVQGLIRFQQDETTARPLASSLAKVGLGEYPVVEVLIRPVDMVTWRNTTGQPPAGDCDDYAMLTAALLRAKGVKASFVTVAADPRMPGQFSHVYVVAYPGGKRVPLDTSHGEYPGWETASYQRREEWPVDAGLGGLLIAGIVALVLWLRSKGRKRRTS